MELTRQAVFAGCVMGVKVQDHVIGDNACYGFAGQGLIRRYQDEWSLAAGKSRQRREP